MSERRRMRPLPPFTLGCTFGDLHLPLRLNDVGCELSIAASAVNATVDKCETAERQRRAAAGVSALDLSDELLNLPLHSTGLLARRLWEAFLTHKRVETAERREAMSRRAKAWADSACNASLLSSPGRCAACDRCHAAPSPSQTSPPHAAAPRSSMTPAPHRTSG